MTRVCTLIPSIFLELFLKGYARGIYVEQQLDVRIAYTACNSVRCLIYFSLEIRSYYFPRIAHGAPIFVIYRTGSYIALGK